MRRHAIQMQQLIRAHAQGGRRFKAQLCIGTCQQRPNARIKRQLPAQGSQHEGGGEVAVLGRERIDLWRAQQLVAVRIRSHDL